MWLSVEHNEIDIFCIHSAETGVGGYNVKYLQQMTHT